MKKYLLIALLLIGLVFAQEFDYETKEFDITKAQLDEVTVEQWAHGDNLEHADSIDRYPNAITALQNKYGVIGNVNGPCTFKDGSIIGSDGTPMDLNEPNLESVKVNNQGNLVVKTKEGETIDIDGNQFSGTSTINNNNFEGNGDVGIEDGSVRIGNEQEKGSATIGKNRIDLNFNSEAILNNNEDTVEVDIPSMNIDDMATNGVVKVSSDDPLSELIKKGRYSQKFPTDYGDVYADVNTMRGLRVTFVPDAESEVDVESSDGRRVRVKGGTSISCTISSKMLWLQPVLKFEARTPNGDIRGVYSPNTGSFDFFAEKRFPLSETGEEIFLRGDVHLRNSDYFGKGVSGMGKAGIRW